MAEALQRSLIIEGIPQSKAEEMAIEKTVDICRETVSSPVVKAVLSATAFASPKEVLAKYIIQLDKSKTETQILTVQRFQPTLRSQFRGNTGRYFSNFVRNNRHRPDGVRGNHSYNINRNNVSRQSRDWNSSPVNRRFDCNRSNNNGNYSSGGRQPHRNIRIVQQQSGNAQNPVSTPPSELENAEQSETSSIFPF